MWPYIAIGITGSIAVILTVYERVKGHLEHKKRMAEMKEMFTDLEKERRMNEPDLMAKQELFIKAEEAFDILMAAGAKVSDGTMYNGIKYGDVRRACTNYEMPQVSYPIGVSEEE